jgi:hypothetical protein
MIRTLVRRSQVSRMGTRERGVSPRLLANQHKTVTSYVSADGEAGTRRKQVTTEYKYEENMHQEVGWSCRKLANTASANG